MKEERIYTSEEMSLDNPEFKKNTHDFFKKVGNDMAYAIDRDGEKESVKKRLKIIKQRLIDKTKKQDYFIVIP